MDIAQPRRAYAQALNRWADREGGIPSRRDFYLMADGNQIQGHKDAFAADSTSPMEPTCVNVYLSVLFISLLHSMQAGCSERLIVQEFKVCTQKLRKGILVQPSVATILQWQLTLMPSNGVFKDQILTAWVSFENFPASVPKVRFQDGVIHPLVDPSSKRFRTNELFPEWNVTIRVYTLLNAVFDAFVDVSARVKVAADQEAVNLIKQGSDVFAQRALRNLQAPPDPAERNEMNAPKRWGNQKERIAHILVALGPQS
jgi:ubiquitin-protein ligase